MFMKNNYIHCLLAIGAMAMVNVTAIETTGKLIWRSIDAGKNGFPEMSYWSSTLFKGKRFALAGQGKDGGTVNGFEIATDTKDENAILMIHLPATPGKTYIVKIRAKAENASEESKIMLFGVAQKSKKTIGTLPRKLIAPIYHKYAEYEFIAKVPDGTVWDQTVKIQFSFGVKNLKGGKIFFDDIQIFECP